MTETEAVTEEMRKWFKHVAGDSYSYIDAKKLKRAMKKGGSGFDLELCDRLCKYASNDEEGKVSVDEFSKLHSFLSKVQQIFSYFDFDKDGKMDMQEAYHAVAHAGFRMQLQPFRAIFKKYDKDEKLRLRYAQYVEMMLHLVSVADQCKKKLKPVFRQSGRLMSLPAHHQYCATAGQNSSSLPRSQSYDMSSGYDAVLMQTYSGTRSEFADSSRPQQDSKSNGYHARILHTHAGIITEETGDDYYPPRKPQNQTDLVSNGMLDTGASIESDAIPTIPETQQQRRLFRCPSRGLASENDHPRVACGQWLGADVPKCVDAKSQQQCVETSPVSPSVSLHAGSPSFKSPFENYKQSVGKQGHSGIDDHSYRNSSLPAQSRQFPSSSSHDSVFRRVSAQRHVRLGHNVSSNLGLRASNSSHELQSSHAPCSQNAFRLGKADSGDCLLQSTSLQVPPIRSSYKSTPDFQRLLGQGRTSSSSVNLEQWTSSSSFDSLAQSIGVQGSHAGGSSSLPQPRLCQLESRLPSSKNEYRLAKDMRPEQGADILSPFRDFPSPLAIESLAPALLSSGSRTATLWSADSTSDSEKGQMSGNIPPSDLIGAYQSNVHNGDVPNEARLPAKTCASLPQQFPESGRVDQNLACGTKSLVDHGRKSFIRKFLRKKPT